MTYLAAANVLSEPTKPMPIKDSLIAASALLHDLTVATRNMTDFHRAGVKVINPFA